MRNHQAFLPDALWHVVQRLPRNLHHAGYGMAARAWSHALDLIVLTPYPNSKKPEVNRREEKIIIQHFIDSGIIQLARPANHILHVSRCWTMPTDTVRRIYTASRDVYHGPAQTDRPRRQVFTGFEHHPELREYLKANPMRWDARQALDTLQSIPDALRANKWKVIRLFVGDELRPSYRLQLDTGLYARRPPIMGTPREFRRIGVMGDDLWDIDFTAQYLQFFLLQHGRPPMDDPYLVLSERTGYPKQSIKAVVNPAFMGQTLNHFIYHARKVNANIMEEVQKYHAIMQGITDAFGIASPKMLSPHYLEQRTAVQVAALHWMQKTGIKLVLALHDGVVIRGTAQDAQATAQAFAQGAQDITGGPMSKWLKAVKVKDLRPPRPGAQTSPVA